MVLRYLVHRTVRALFEVSFGVRSVVRRMKDNRTTDNRKQQQSSTSKISIQHKRTTGNDYNKKEASKDKRMQMTKRRPVQVVCLLWGLTLAAEIQTASATSTSSLSRQSVLFDFGWKHRTGLTDWAQPDDLPPTQTDPGGDPPEAQPDYDDQDWLDVQLPHDGLIVNPPSQTACPQGCSGRSYIPRHLLWYRKTFRLPPKWVSTPSIISLEFEGSFRNTTVFLNGQRVLNHVCGYTPFSVLITNQTLPQQSIAVFVDPDNGDGGSPSSGSGWWYEGGGLYRHVRLLRTSPVHVARHGLFVKSHLLDSHASKTTPVQATAAVLEMEATIDGGETSGDQSICYHFDITPPEDGQAKISTPVKEVLWKDKCCGNCC